MKCFPPWASTLVLAGVLLSGGCRKVEHDQPDAIILHTGRLLGNINPEKMGKAVPLQHYPYLSAYVKKVRAEAAAQNVPVFLIDLGDSLGGSFASYALRGENMVGFFNTLGYDALCLGNLDGDVDPATIAALHAPVLTPFVDGEGKPAMPGSRLSAELEKSGVVLDLAANFYGLTNAAEHPLRFPTAFGPSQARPVAVRDYRKISAAFDKPGALKILSWMKFEDAGAAEKRFLGDLSKWGFNLILAHRIYGEGQKDVWTAASLQRSKPPVSINILRNNSGFTVARVDLKRNGRQWQVLRQSIVPMTANTVEADTEIIRQMDRFAPALARADHKVADLSQRWEPNDILPLYLSALTEIPGAHAVAYALDSVRTGWAPGELRTSQVFNALPWRNDIVTIALARSQLPALGKIAGLVLLTREDLPDPVSVVTSRFFAHLIQQQTGLEQAVITSTGPQLEFEHLVRFIQSRSPLKAATKQEGWSNAQK